MHKILIWCVLVLTPLTVMGADQEVESQYTGWCTRKATAEKIPADDREDYIQECIAALSEADKNPDSSGRKRKRGDEDEG